MSESRPRSEPRSGVYRSELSALADMVMSHSLPTPTQDEIDKVTKGESVEIAPDKSPQMPPLHEQYAKLAAAEPAHPAPPRPAARPA